MKIQGVLPVLQVPYVDDYGIDFATLDREIKWLFDNGVDGVVFGMVSEILRMTDAERDALVAAAIKSAAGHGPVVASAGAESIQQAIRHAKAAQEAGADAVMVTPPALTRTNSDEIKRYYMALIQATKLPVIIQDASGYIGNPIPVATQAELFRAHPDRVMFKPEAPPIGANLSALRDATGGKAAIFEGTGGVALADSFRRGIAGTMPGSEMPWAFTALWKALRAGDEKKASRIHAPIAALISQCNSLDVFLILEKTLLVKQGIFKNTLVRGPVGFKLDRETEAEMLRLFEVIKQSCEE